MASVLSFHRFPRRRRGVSVSRRRSRGTPISGCRREAAAERSTRTADALLARAFVLVLAVLPPAAFAQPADEPQADDPFAAFDEAFEDFDEGFEDEAAGLVWSGFVEGAYGRRIDSDIDFRRQSLGDVRARAETEWSNESLLVTFKGDLNYDDYESDWDADARELSLQLSPADAVDLKLGRQVLTWGTGDLVFLNDLFPKSWVSFFSGRDDEYLKASSDAVRATWYNDAINVDAVWSPRFEPDDYLTGERFSFFVPLAGRVVAPRPPLDAPEPGQGELALRLFRTVGPTEYAAYFYNGFFKRPLGLTASFGPAFPDLSVYGASLRRPLGSGLVNAELAFHDSRDDPRGDDPLVPNDQLRMLVGYEFEARSRFTVGLQYYAERTMNYGDLLATSLAPEFEPERTRHVLTNRLTYRTARDRWTLSLFTFFSPNDDDFYLRPSVSLRQSDRWTVSAGANLFGGERQDTFFGQLENNSNAWLRVRFGY